MQDERRIPHGILLSSLHHATQTRAPCGVMKDRSWGWAGEGQEEASLAYFKFNIC
jgi:hypothetical protein